MEDTTGAETGRRSLRELARDPRLGTPQVQVRNVATGEVLFDLDGDTPNRTASVLKLLTASAAVSVLGPGHRATTTAVAGERPGEVVLVGGGDLTLSRLPSGAATLYPGVAHLDDLAGQVRAAWAANPANGEITRVTADASLFAGERWLPSWGDSASERELDGSTPYLTALQLDADREDPLEAYSPRGDDPVGFAARTFAALLGEGVRVAEGRAPAGAAVLGRVSSPPVRELVVEGLLASDNAIMEMLARLVAIESGAGNTFDDATRAVLGALAALGVPTDGVRLIDGSGLSHENAVPPSYLTRLLALIARREPPLDIVYDGLPMSGTEATGTLASGRFTGTSSVVGDAVRAKTGWIDNTYTLAGLVRAHDGSTLSFAVYALGEVDSSAREAIDALVAEFFLRGGDAAAYRE